MVLSEPKLPKSLQLHFCYQLMGINFYHTNAILIDSALIRGNTVY